MNPHQRKESIMRNTVYCPDFESMMTQFVWTLSSLTSASVQVDFDNVPEAMNALARVQNAFAGRWEFTRRGVSVTALRPRETA